MRALLLLTALLVGCVNLNPNTMPLKLEAGPEPTIEQADQVVHDYLARALKDPDSLKQYRFISLQKTRWMRGALAGGGSEEGWLACFEYNAKNSYGGYIGVKVEGLIIRGSAGSFWVVDGVMGQIKTVSC
jgi:hypothetical protein